MICTNCKRPGITDTIDVSKMFNCSKGIVFVCSKKCKKELIANLKDGFPLKSNKKKN